MKIKNSRLDSCYKHVDSNRSTNDCRIWNSDEKVVLFFRDLFRTFFWKTPIWSVNRSLRFGSIHCGCFDQNFRKPTREYVQYYCYWRWKKEKRRLGPKVFFSTIFPGRILHENITSLISSAGRLLTLRWFTNVCIIRNDCGARCGLTNKRIIAYREIDFV